MNKARFSTSLGIAVNEIDLPLTLRCGLQLPNRTMLAPLTNLQSNADGTLGDDELNWLVRRARGGFGLVSTCAAFVSDEGRAWNGQLGIARAAHEHGLSRLAASLAASGAHAIVQLHHAGAKATLAPERRLSAVDQESVRGANRDDIQRVVSDFAEAATRAERAGFAGVEIHGANGYLFTQFLSPADNLRTDEYGGELEGRARFLRETLKAVRAAVSTRFAVGVRLSPVDLGSARGLLLADSVQVAEWLSEDGMDFVHLSLADASAIPPNEPDKGPVARAFRDRLPDDIPVLAAGSIWTREDARRAIAAGVDMVVTGRAAIVHPDWPRDSSTEGWQPSRPPWSPDQLREVAVGSAFLEYLARFPGMVEGGEPPRSEAS